MGDTSVQRLVLNSQISYQEITDSLNRQLEQIEDNGYEVINIITIGKGIFALTKKLKQE